VTQLCSHTLTRETPLSPLSRQEAPVLHARPKRKRLFVEHPNPEGGVVARFGLRSQIDTNGGISLGKRKRKREREIKRKKRKAEWERTGELYRTERTNKTRLSAVSEYRG